MTTKEKPIAFLDWSLDVDCPHCEREVDLVRLEADAGDNSIAGRIFNNRWDHLKDWLIECPHCKHDFQIDHVEY